MIIMKEQCAWVLLLAICLIACRDSQPTGTEKTVQEIKTAGPISNSDIIRNPVSAEGPVDTVNVARLTFDEARYDFGEVPEGEKVEHTYTFTNTGRVPLIISNARSTCGCTVPTWPKTPIAPGETGAITVAFDTSGKPNRQSKPVTITANTYPANTVVYLEGFVQAKKKDATQ